MTDFIQSLKQEKSYLPSLSLKHNTTQQDDTEPRHLQIIYLKYTVIKNT